MHMTRTMKKAELGKTRKGCQQALFLKREIAALTFDNIFRSARAGSQSVLNACKILKSNRNWSFLKRFSSRYEVRVCRPNTSPPSHVNLHILLPS